MSSMMKTLGPDGATFEVVDTAGVASILVDGQIVAPDPVVDVPQDSIADPAAITGYTPHTAGAVPVVSEAATDLDTTAAALSTLRGEVDSLRTTLVDVISKLELAGIITTV